VCAAIENEARTIRLRVGCEFGYDVKAPTAATVQVRPRFDPEHQLLSETWSSNPPMALDEFTDLYGNGVKRLTLVPGDVRLGYDAVVEVPDSWDPVAPEVGERAIEDLPGELLHYTLPSRYCPSYDLMDTAWELFGGTPRGWGRAQAICDWVFANIKFRYGASQALTTAADVLAAREGVCRDFAHLGVTFCRAMNLPARYAFGYIPDIGEGIEVSPDPMDFCAWMEVWLGDRWWTFDPRNNRPRLGRVLIGRGRDALDVAMLTTYGPATFKTMTVWADWA
jgi:transglutaminase-like putative cysteine protease